jgi:hypothetical protein
VENQKLIVTVYTNTKRVEINSTTYVMDSVSCYTLNGTICASCRTYYAAGWVGCHQGLFSCEATYTCKECATSNCSYTVPYYNIRSSGTTVYADSMIDANVTMYFENRSEGTSTAMLLFKVSNCNWVFNKFIT